MSKSFEELADKRRKWVEINKENNFDEGIKRLLTELYPDNAHFIYELLQNAEDTKASKVRFVLKSESIEFEHNGQRSFSLNDVESITSIGASTKRDDHTSIGKFGVGFKAVFAYTSSPEIISDTYHFIIRDLVVPEIQESQDKKTGATPKTTRFIFPFNNPAKSSKRAVEEIQRGLSELKDNSLLFLTHIREIHYIFPNGSEGLLQRTDLDEGQIKITSVQPKQKKTISHWLRFTKEVKVESEENIENSLVIAVAYALEEVTKKTKQGIQKEWAITPCNPGQVSIFFPAEKETSKLHFHLHAPFASTVARDSIRDCYENDVLRDHLASLVVESLFEIRDKGLLTTSFLSVLPNPSDQLSGFYEPVRQGIVDAFNANDLVPTISGKHAPANTLCIGPAKISSLIGGGDLSFLANENYQWAASPLQNNIREKQFLDSLKVTSWGWSEFAQTIDRLCKIPQIVIEEWLTEKSDYWLFKLYSLFGEAFKGSSYRYTNSIVFAHLRVLRVQHEGEDKLVCPKDVFFTPSDQVAPPQGSYFVKIDIYDKGTESQKEHANYFLKKIGVRELDAKALIQIKLKEYTDNKPHPDDSHFFDIKSFVNFWKENPNESQIFLNSKFVYSFDESGSGYICSPRAIFIDEPFGKTGLSDLENIHKKRPLWKEYKSKLPVTIRKYFIDFIKNLGAMSTLKVERTSVFNNKYRENLGLSRGRTTNSQISNDYSIKSIEEYIDEKSVSASKLLWHALLAAESISSTAKYRPNQQYSIKTVDSQLVYHLKDNAWIPDKEGFFYKPENISRDQLRDDFPFNDENGLLTAIMFGEKANIQSKENKEKDEAAKKLGLESAKDIELFKKLKEAGISDKELQDFINSKIKHEKPESSVPNPERRRKGILEQSSNAHYKESEIRERTVQKNTHEETVKAKAYLRARYENNKDQMICQCCHKEMPFKVNGEYYFEAVQCLRQLDKHHSQNRLALCPVCSAMYRHALETAYEEIMKMIVEHEASDDSSSASISIRMAGEEYQMYFVGTHWFDLKALLNINHRI